MTFNIFKNHLLVNIGPISEKVITSSNRVRYTIIKAVGKLSSLEMNPEDLHMAFNQCTAKILEDSKKWKTAQ